MQEGESQLLWSCTRGRSTFYSRKCSAAPNNRQKLCLQKKSSSASIFNGFCPFPLHCRLHSLTCGEHSTWQTKFDTDWSLIHNLIDHQYSIQLYISHDYSENGNMQSFVFAFQFNFILPFNLIEAIKACLVEEQIET